MDREQRGEQRKRLNEIVEVLRRNEIVRGMTPDKLCAVMEELGPTFIKLGQILSMRSDFLPQEYCDALTRLCTQVEPMPFEQVEAILEDAYGRPLSDVFASFDRQALGSASIAQVHAATLPTGEKVVVKVQRQGIHDIMNRDIILLKRAAELVKYTPHKGLVDFNRVLDEMWIVAQQEMNFLTEASNLETFTRLNGDVAFVSAPKLYPMYTAASVLVMENVEGIPINEKDALTEAGYDLNEIGAKLADNYVKQITEDGFFHADPHPGNIRIRDGKIVFLDMGMMGTLSERDRRTISRAVEGVARNDPEACLEAVLKLGVVSGDVDRRQLYKDCETMLDRYGSIDLGTMDLSQVVTDIMEIMKKNRIGMPGGLSMLVRGLATVEGVVVDVAPGISVIQVATARIRKKFLKDFDLRGNLQRDARALYESAYKTLDIPSLVSDTLRTGLKGDGRIGADVHPDEDAEKLAQALTQKICAALVCAALILASAVGTSLQPVWIGLSWYQMICIAAALIMMIPIFLQKKK